MDDREIVDPGAPPEWRFLFAPLVFIQVAWFTHPPWGRLVQRHKRMSILEIWLRKKVTTKYFQERDGMMLIPGASSSILNEATVPKLV